MKDKKLISYTLINELEAMIKSFYGEKYYVSVITTEVLYTLSTNSFIMTYSIPDEKFFLTFMIGSSGVQIGTDMKLIMNVFEGDEFTIIEDSYIDKKEGLVFGIEAIACKQTDILAKAGKVKCPICEKIYDISKINSNNICKFCDLDSMIWN